MKASESNHPFKTGAAFTLVEVLVAMTVFIVMAVMVASLTDGAMRTVGQSQRRISIDAGARQALDRIASDLARAVSRKDIPFRVEKAEGNDQIAFVADVDGYTDGRGVSVVGYRVVGGHLQRGVEARSWGVSGSSALAFTSVASAASDPVYLEMNNASFETLSSDVFRFEIAFLMSDGSIVERVGTPIGGGTSSYVATFGPAPGASAAETIHAVIVGIVALDGPSRETLQSGALEGAAGTFPDAEAAKDLSGIWKGFLTADEASMPSIIRKSVRFYQRYIFVAN